MGGGGAAPVPGAPVGAEQRARMLGCRGLPVLPLLVMLLVLERGDNPPHLQPVPGSGDPEAQGRRIDSLDPALLEAVLANPVLLRSVDAQVLQEVLVRAATAVANTPDATFARQRFTAPLGIPEQFQELPVFPARLAQGLPGATHRNLFPAFGEGDHRQNPRFQLPPEVAQPHLDPFRRYLPSDPYPGYSSFPFSSSNVPNLAGPARGHEIGGRVNITQKQEEEPVAMGFMDMKEMREREREMADVEEAEDVEDFGQGNVRNYLYPDVPGCQVPPPFPVVAGGAAAGRPEVAEFPVRRPTPQTPRQATSLPP